ncbi:MAG: branched-chain amino acid ABC transporter ATP-binding protein [Ancylobacter novellus]|uniref:Branched-chain amino acid ABC transporter ATP-binding protein n=1 Tax=Ancylobacter novellus TaxID=921 RepID=A0A2W5KGG6_ANCNO|nr:MAG: branched-chain amino acid ABC transporter ATP-binding protein [Ancylobacter novellus]
MTALLDVRDLSCSYGAGPVVTSVSLTVEPDQALAIVGPNGHGKTSLLRAISGLMPDRTGSVRFDGVDIGRMRPDAIARLGVVHVPQGDLVYKQMTILENLLLGAWANASRSVTADRLDDVFAIFPKLKERQSQFASSLSGGERRMLGIGRGLMMHGARLLMLDEPSLGLAPIVIDEIFRCIATLKTRGLSIVVVEENVTRAASVASQIHLMDRGQFVWSGDAADARSSRKLLETYLGVGE